MKLSYFLEELEKIITVNDFNTLKFNVYNYFIVSSFFLSLFSLITSIRFHLSRFILVSNIQNNPSENEEQFIPAIHFNFLTSLIGRLELSYFICPVKKHKLVYSLRS